MTDLNVSGNLRVEGTSTFVDAFFTVQNAFVSNFLRVGALQAVGFNVLAALQVDLTSEFRGTVTCSSVGNGLVVDNNATVSGNLSVIGLATLSQADVINAATVGSLVCQGSGQFTGAGTALTVTNAALIGTLQVLGPASSSVATVTGAATVGSLVCQGSGEFTGAGTSLTVTNDAQLGSLACGSGQFTGAGTSLTVTNDAQLGSLTVSGASTLNTATASSNVDINGQLTYKKRSLALAGSINLTSSQSGTLVIFTSGGNYGAFLPANPPPGTQFDFVTNDAGIYTITGPIRFVDNAGTPHTVQSLTSTGVGANVSLVWVSQFPQWFAMGQPANWS